MPVIIPLMRLRGLVLALLGLLGLGCVATLNAQPTLPCEGSYSCGVGSSLSFDLGALFELQTLVSIIDGVPGASFTYSFALTGGTLPPGVSLSQSGLFSGTLTQAGTFSFTVSLTEKLTYMDETLLDQSFPFPLTFMVGGYSGPTTTVDPAGLSFSLAQNGPAVSQSVTVSNYGSQAAQFSASATTNSDGNWLTIGASGGAVASFSTSAISVTADPSHLTPGTYSGTVMVLVAGSPPLEVSVLAVVSGNQPSIELSQTGLRFQAVSGGTATSPQSISVLNPGVETLNFSASASVISGGNWLSVSPASGTSTSSTANAVTVTVNPAGLQPGNYYGKVQFSASGAANSPQVASVVLNVVSAANSPGAFLAPAGLIFVGSVGGSDPATQTLSITNPSPDELTYLVTSFSNSGSDWLTATPASGSVSATQPATVSVQPSLQGLAPGVYTGDLTFTIVPTSATASTAAPQVYHVEVLLLVLPAGSSASVQPASKSAPRPHASGCTPTKLLPVFTMLGTGFSATAAWPTAIEVTVVDDCGNPLVSGSVTATFSSGDPALSLDSLHDGRWTGTWNATHAASGVTVTAQAQEIQPVLMGLASIGGTLQANTSTPAVSAGGVIGVFNSVPNQPLAPGGYAAIYGSNLSDGLNVSPQLPFSLELGGTSVFLSGEQLPLYFTSEQQINAVLPYDVPVNSTQQILVQKGSAISIPQAVVIAPAQPAILANTGSTDAVVLVYKPDGSGAPMNSPVGADYVITLYCTGLGAVTPSVAAGSPAPASPLSNTVNPVTVTIGKVEAHVLFAGLVPTYAQLYQVNIKIPAGLSSGSDVLTLSVGGQQSAPVTIAVQ